MTMARPVAVELAVGLAARPVRHGWPEFVRRRLSGRPDSEHEIFVNRLALSWVIEGCVVVAAKLGSVECQQVLAATYWMFWVYNAMAVGLVIHLLAFPAVSALRRCIGICIDFWIIAGFDHAGDSTTAFIYPLYLWTIFGNGFRFGIQYLGIATAAGVAAFGFVVLTGDYWRANPTVAAGLVGGLVILPAYVGVLIRKLSIAKRQAEEANKAKSMFLASVSHELRTPLTAIIGLTDLLQDTRLSREQTDMAQTVGSAGRGLLRLINSILDVSRTEAGTAPAGAKRLDLHLLLVQTQAMLSVQAAAKGVRLSLHIGARTPRFIDSSEQHLQEILVNLGGNAVKFTDTGNVSIFSDLVWARDGRLRLRFEVEDTGIGIARDAQTRIFDTFTQADETIIDRFGGTGLGLAISRQLVQSLDGEIGVASAKGEGSRFWFEIEAWIGIPDAAIADIAAGRPVLIFSEDHRLQAAVEQLGADARIVTNFAQAAAGIKLVDAQGEYRPVVLLDEAALGGDLENMAERLTAREGRSAAILVAVSAGANPDILSRAARRLFATCLPRPLAGTPLANLLHVADGRTSAQPGGMRAHRAQAPRKVHVLLAEDNRTNQKIIARILERAGHSVEVVGDGEAALDALQDRTFQIVLMDINMPVLNGVEAAKLYRFGHLDGPPVPIIALTADASEASRARCIEAGMQDCLTKPIDAAHLMATIETYAGKPATPASAGPAKRRAVSRDESEVLDMVALGDLEALGGTAFIEEIVTQFIADAALVLKCLGAAVRDGDVETFKDQAHALRSCAANVGAQRVYATCLAWREIGRTDLARNGASYFAELSGDLAAAQASLASYLDSKAVQMPPESPATKPQLRIVS